MLSSTSLAGFNMSHRSLVGMSSTQPKVKEPEKPMEESTFEDERKRYSEHIEYQDEEIE